MKNSKLLQIKKRIKSKHCLTIKDRMEIKGGGVILIPVLGINGRRQ